MSLVSSIGRPLLACALSITAAVSVMAPDARGASGPPLRVCADPNNLPFSNAHGDGFENAVADVVARALGRHVEYFWQPQRRGFLRTTLQAHRCDVVMSVPSTQERLRHTRPYYRSTYVFVSQRARHLDVRSFDDPRLAALRIGIQITGDDYDNPPAAHALALRGLVNNLRGFPVYGDYSQPAPQRAIVNAVAASDVDIAVVWGPIAGYFASLTPVPLTLDPVVARPGVDVTPFTFDLAIGVRPDDVRLGHDLDAALQARAPQIRRILNRFAIPRAS